MKNSNILNLVKQNKIITIVRGVETDKIVNLFSALCDGGIKIAEITFGKFDDETTFNQIKIICEKFKDKMLIGAGTVTTLKRAELAVKAGASYIVSPVTNKDIINYVKDRGLQVISGAFTPTEIKNAQDMGADIVKLFPANILGPNYIKSILQPLSDIPIVCFGGINSENLESYIKAGAVGAGIGADIINMEDINNCNFQMIKERALKVVNVVKNLNN